MCFAMVEMKITTCLYNTDTNENQFLIRKMFDYYFAILSKQNKQQTRYERIMYVSYLCICISLNKST